MVRPRKAEKEKLVNTGLSIPPQVNAEVEKMLETSGRVKGQLLRLIFMRGWAAYKRDGKLVEPPARREAPTPADEFDAARGKVGTKKSATKSAAPGKRARRKNGPDKE